MKETIQYVLSNVWAKVESVAHGETDSTNCD